MDFSPDKIRERFHELSAKASSLHETLDPLRKELADLVCGETKLSVKAAVAREAEVREHIRAGNAKLAPIEMERAACARALGGKTGPLQEDAAFLAAG